MNMSNIDYFLGIFLRGKGWGGGEGVENINELKIRTKQKNPEWVRSEGV